MKYSAVFALSVALGASARPQVVRRADFTLKNGQDAIALNDKFKTLTASSACTAGENACINDQFAQCANGKFVTTACGTGTVCAALPLVNSAGTSITCTTAAERDQRIAATGATDAGAGAGASSSAAGASSSAAAGASSSAAAGASSSAAAPPASTSGVNNAGGGAGASSSSAAGAAPTGGAGNTGDPNTSTTIDPANIQKLTNDGQDQPEAGQVASQTSSNNYINFCLGQTPTNGAQVKSGSCNQVPMGQIPSTANQVSCAFAFPVNGQNVDANTDFTIKMNIQGMQTGAFTNAAQTYYMGPQQVSKTGQVIGHSHVTVEQIDSLQSTKPLDPNKFVFFKGLNEAAQNGQLTADVAGGVPAGTYKVSSINAAANHQPFLGPIAQRGSYDCVSYFTVGDASNTGNALGGGAGAGNATAGAGGAGAAGAGAGAATSSAAAAGASKGAAAGGAGAGAAATSSAAAAGATGKGAAGAANTSSAAAAAASGKGAAAGAATSSAAASAASGKGAADAGKAGADASKGAAASSSAAGAAATDKAAQGKGN